jgi:excisionase family DNA binding protein
MENAGLIAVAPNTAFAMLGVGITKGYQLINSGELEAFKIGRATRITTESIRAYVARQLEQARAKSILRAELSPDGARSCRSAG